MMPLCTTASFALACGWALFSVGLPCVAQRVWPMPIAPPSGCFGEKLLEILELAAGAPAAKTAVVEGGDPGGIIAAIFEPLQRVEKKPRDGTLPQNADNAAHDLSCSVL